MFHKNKIIVLLIFLSFSCKESKKDIVKINPPKKKVENKIDPIEVPKKETTESRDDLVSTLLANSHSYRMYGDDPTKQLNSNWFDLFKKGGKFFIEKAEYTITNEYDECAEMEAKSINTKRKTLLLLDYKKLAVGKVDNLNIPNQYVWPNEKTEFVFNNQKYYLRAEGKIKTTENRTDEAGQNEVWHDVENYKLFIKTETSKEELLLSEQSFNDTFVKLLFVGDLDRDGQLDFIFEANRDYEEERVILFLSSEAKENKLLQKVSEISIGFDC